MHEIHAKHICCLLNKGRELHFLSPVTPDEHSILCQTSLGMFVAFFEPGRSCHCYSAVKGLPCGNLILDAFASRASSSHPPTPDSTCSTWTPFLFLWKPCQSLPSKLRLFYLFGYSAAVDNFHELEKKLYQTQKRMQTNIRLSVVALIQQKTLSSWLCPLFSTHMPGHNKTW